MSIEIIKKLIEKEISDTKLNLSRLENALLSLDGYLDETSKEVSSKESPRLFSDDGKPLNFLGIEPSLTIFGEFSCYMNEYINPARRIQVLSDFRNKLNDAQILEYMKEHKEQHENYKAPHLMMYVYDIKAGSGINWSDTAQGHSYWSKLLKC